MSGSQRLKEMVKTFKRKDLQECLAVLQMSKAGNKDQLAANLLFCCGLSYAGNGKTQTNDALVKRAIKIVEYKYGEINKNMSRADSIGTASGNKAISCVCGNNSDFGRMIQCDAEDCGVWQHVHCVGLMGTDFQNSAFFCEKCRMQRADPFKELKQVIFTALLRGTGARAATTNGKVEAVVGAEQSFRLSPELFRSIKESPGSRKSMQLQVLCVQLGDPTPFRFHWPLYAELRINKMPYRVYRRGNATKLGANGRDDSYSVGKHCKEGTNAILLTAVDSRPFVLISALVRQRSMEEVMAMMAPRETLPCARQRIRNAISGKADGDGDDSDDDIVVLSTVISLKCPLTGMRVKKPARFTDVSGLNVFDLDAFLSMVQRNHKWQCPHTMKNSSIQFLQVDTYLERVLEAIKDEEINEIEVSPEGHWRPAGTDGRFRDISEDHSLAEPLSAVKVKAEQVAICQTSSDEEDEAAELQRTAAELSQSGASKPPSSPKGGGGEVIVISDSDSDDSPPPKRTRAEPSSSNPPTGSKLPASNSQVAPASASGLQHSASLPGTTAAGSGNGATRGVRISLGNRRANRPAPPVHGDGGRATQQQQQAHQEQEQRHQRRRHHRHTTNPNSSQQQQPQQFMGRLPGNGQQPYGSDSLHLLFQDRPQRPSYAPSSMQRLRDTPSQMGLMASDMVMQGMASRSLPNDNRNPMSGRQLQAHSIPLHIAQSSAPQAMGFSDGFNQTSAALSLGLGFEPQQQVPTPGDLATVYAQSPPPPSQQQQQQQQRETNNLALRLGLGIASSTSPRASASALDHRQQQLSPYSSRDADYMQQFSTIIEQPISASVLDFQDDLFMNGSQAADNTQFSSLLM